MPKPFEIKNPVFLGLGMFELPMIHKKNIEICLLVGCFEVFELDLAFEAVGKSMDIRFDNPQGCLFMLKELKGNLNGRTLPQVINVRLKRKPQQGNHSRPSWLTCLGLVQRLFTSSLKSFKNLVN